MAGDFAKVWPMNENQSKFLSLYTENLAAAFRDKPQEYGGQKPENAPIVAQKMVRALAEGTGNLGEAAKKTAKQLGIRPIYKGVRDFLNKQ